MTPMWRALTVFRIAAWVYAAILAVDREAEFSRPVPAFAVIAVMAGWTAFTARRHLRRPPPGRALLVADVVIASLCVLATPLVLPRPMITTTLPVTWIAGPVLAWAIAHGRRAGLVSALVPAGCCIAAFGGLNEAGADEAVLLLLTGFVVGHVVRLLAVAEEQTRRAAAVQAAAAERDRLARAVHDSVLQVLALVQRRGAEIGGPAAELGRLAGEQEAALRALVSAEARPAGAAGGYEGGFDGGHGHGDDAADLRLALADLIAVGTYPGTGTGIGADAGSDTGTSTTLAGPADPVVLPASTVAGLTAAVAAALDNVRKHAGAGARSWILVEDEEDVVTVTVRDDGPGIPDGRLAQAAAAGRLGVAQSMCGRVADLGGTARIISVPGQGTEIELRVPRR
jgi:signal transduction histidine kinase